MFSGQKSFVLTRSLDDADDSSSEDSEDSDLKGDVDPLEELLAAASADVSRLSGASAASRFFRSKMDAIR